jgi:rhamnosyltransferase subunit B
VHFLCSTYGSSGDVYPLLGLALELRRRGHEVTVATNDYYAPVAARLGIPFEPLGTAADFEACVRNSDLWHPRRGFRHVFESLRPSLRRQYEIHVEAAARGPVVGVTQCFGMGALLAREKIGIPVVSLHVQPAVLWSDIDPPSLPGVFGPRWLRSWLYGVGEKYFIDPVVCPFLNGWRAELGLPPVKKITRWWHSPDGVIAMFPHWFAAPQPDWPKPLWQTDFPLWNDRADQPLADDVQRFLRQGSPPIVFTPGSTNVHGATFFRVALETCERLQHRGIFLTDFPEQIPHSLPDSIAHFRYVPLDRLLPHSAAFVHHGGIGSMSQALLAGVPQVLMPLAHDQFDNAERVRRMGVGDGVPASKFTTGRLVRALHPLLDSPDVTTRCQATARKLAGRDGIRLAADALERNFATK